ncbi:MAG: glycosyltransferase family 4 protein [Candidatus Moranbacteria bacterium]|nr:glycosyltransferase family 4 protein [Candidatus Moranbacteria bacterium]
MRIAIFSDTFPPEINGVANFVYSSAKTLSERGHQVKVFTASRISQKRLNEKIGKNFQIFTVPSIHSPIYPNTRIPLPTGLTLPYLLKFKPDIIHAHTPFTLGWGAIMGAKILGVPLVGTHHTFFDHYLKHAKIDFAVARRATWRYTVSFYNYCDLVTVPSHSLAQEMKSHGLKKPITVLPNLVDVALFKLAAAAEKSRLKKHFKIKKKSLVYMGRLSYEKSIGQVIRAFKIASRKIPDLQLMIIGDGPERENLKKLAKKLGVAKKTTFTGFLRGRKLINALQANDIFVTASKTETFCIAALEAMAVGLPVVAVGEKGPTEFIKDKINGFLVKDDRPKMMADKITKLITNKQIRKQFGEKSRTLAEKYSKEKNIAKLEKIYESQAKIN